MKIVLTSWVPWKGLSDFKGSTDHTLRTIVLSKPGRFYKLTPTSEPPFTARNSSPWFPAPSQLLLYISMNWHICFILGVIIIDIIIYFFAQTVPDLATGSAFKMATLVFCASFWTNFKRFFGTHMKPMLTDEWIKKMWHIYTMEYYSAIKRNKTELFVARWIDLETVIQCEVSQKKKNKYRVLTHIYGI